MAERVCAEMYFEALSCCDLAQNLETAQLLISINPYFDKYSIVHNRDANGYYFIFVGIAVDTGLPFVLQLGSSK